MAAIALCAAAYFPAKYKFTVPMIALLISDVVLNIHYGFSLLSPFVLSHYLGFAMVGCLGLLLQNRTSMKTLLPASIAGSLIFYIVTNSVSWLFDPGYVKNFAGLIQALTVGLPQYSATPSWMFFRNSVVSDLLFTVLFVVCMNLGRSPERSRARAVLASHRLDRHAAAGATRRSRNALADAVDSAFRGAREPAVSSAENGGFCHLYIGQEAVVTGAVAAVRDDDYIITAYRDHAHALARGTSADACMAELFGKETGCSHGLGGSMHFFDKKHHMYGGHAIVAAHVPLAAGMAFASKYRSEDRVTLCFFGDGAINQGAFHEALESRRAVQTADRFHLRK